MTQPHPNSHYQHVAAIWLGAWRKGRPSWPTTAVQQRFGVPYTTAARWVKRARELGFLTERYKRAHACPNCGAFIDCPRGEV